MKKDKITEYIALSNQLKFKVLFRKRIAPYKCWDIDDKQSFDRKVSHLLYKGDK